MSDGLIFVAFVLGTIGVGACLATFLFAFIKVFGLIREFFAELEDERRSIR